MFNTPDKNCRDIKQHSEEVKEQIGILAKKWTPVNRQDYKKLESFYNDVNANLKKAKHVSQKTTEDSYETCLLNHGFNDNTESKVLRKKLILKRDPHQIIQTSEIEVMVTGLRNIEGKRKSNQKTRGFVTKQNSMEEEKYKL